MFSFIRLTKKGIVILMIDERMSPSAAKDIVKGQGNNLNSAFNIQHGAQFVES